MNDNDDKTDWEKLLSEIFKAQRPYAGHFSWTKDSTITEQGVLTEFVAALEMNGSLFFKDARHRGEHCDPPDCEAVNNDGGRIAIEITELVSQESIEAAVERKSFEEKSWRHGALEEAILERVMTKDSKTLKEGPYADYVLLIFSDEPDMGAEFVEEVISRTSFGPTKQISRAFLLLSYSPFIEGYPCYELKLG